MGIVGAVMATLFSYITITIWMFHDLFIKKSEFRLDIRTYHINLPIIKKLISFFNTLPDALANSKSTSSSCKLIYSLIFFIIL